jgi:hypothetical protein
LRQQNAEVKGAQQWENAAGMEEIAGLRRQEEKFLQSDKARTGYMDRLRKRKSESQVRFPQNVADLQQQFTQLSGAQSSSDEAVGELRRMVLPRKKFPFTSEPLGGLIVSLKVFLRKVC